MDYIRCGYNRRAKSQGGHGCGVNSYYTKKLVAKRINNRVPPLPTKVASGLKTEIGVSSYTKTEGDEKVNSALSDVERVDKSFLT